MSRSYALSVNVAVAVAMMMMTIGSVSLEDAGRNSGQIDRPVALRMGDIVVPRNPNTPFTESSRFFFLHWLKYKPRYQKLDKISSTTTQRTPDCICVPFYLCDDNQTIINDGAGIIDVRIRQCAGALEVCCYPRNATGSPIMTPTTVPTVPPTTASTTTTTTTLAPTTLPPVIFPTDSTSPPVTGLPNQNCICVDIALCDPNGIVSISGEGVINPRQQYGLCPGANQVCCRILIITPQPTTTTTTTPASTTMTPAPTTMTPAPTTMTPAPTTTTTTTPTTTTMTVPPGQTQLCFVCNNTIICFTCAIIITPDGNGTIDPRFSQILSGGNMCALTSLLTCPGTTVTPITDLLGPLKNSGTPQACYCVKTWLCSEGNAVSPDGQGVIDPRFTGCSSADEVCCKPAGIDLQGLRSAGTSTPSNPLVSGRSDFSSEITCGLQNNTYAPPQPYSVDSGKTYFAEFPWMVALLLKPANGSSYVFNCGASMISSGAVLTAAHCVANRKPGDLVARFGQWDIENNTQPLPTQDANIIEIVTHPTYNNGGLFHDVAVLVLERSIAYSANIMPICLPDQGMVFPAGTRCYGIGWGSDSFGPEGKYQAELRKVDLPIVERTDCQARLRNTKLGPYFQLHGSFICAGGEANRDTCRGDGGGPLVCQATTGQFFQAGIVSWGIGCGASNVPAVYASVPQHRQWIDRQLATYGVQ